MGRKAAVLVLFALAVALAPVAVAWACTPPGFGTPALSLSAGQGVQGRSVTVTGMGFAPPATVSITLSPDPGPGVTTVLGEATPTATGQISATVTIPDVPPGPYMIKAANQGPAPFEVIAPTPPPDVAVAPSSPEPAQSVFGLAPAALTLPAIVASTDGAPPSATVRLMGGSRLATVLRRGLAFSIAASEACRIDGRASLSVPAAKSLGLPAIIARRSTALAGRGTSALVMRLSQRARQGLRRQRTASLRVTLTLTDRAGNRSFVLRTVRLRR